MDPIIAEVIHGTEWLGVAIQIVIIVKHEIGGGRIEVIMVGTDLLLGTVIVTVFHLVSVVLKPNFDLFRTQIRGNGQGLSFRS